MDFKIEIRRAIEEEKRKKKEIEKMIKKEGLESVGGGERKEKLRERGQVVLFNGTTTPQT